MADTERTRAELLALFASGQAVGDIDSQDMRDYVVTTDINSLSTGLIDGGILSANGTITVDISAGTGVFVNNHTDPLVHKRVSWSAFIAEAIPDIVANPATFFGLDLSSGTAVVVRSPIPFTAEERRDFISLGPVVHSGSVIDNIGATYSFALDERQTLVDFAEAIGGINMSGGNIYSPNGANLEIDKSAGSTFFVGDNYQNSKKSPNNTVDPIQTPVPTILYTYQDGVGGFTIVPPTVPAVIDPFLWDNGSGSLIEVPNSLKFSIQRIWGLPLINITFIHYAQATYSTMADAQAAINTEAFNKNPGLVSQFRAWLIVEKGTTDLLNGNALFVAAGKFGDVLRE